MPERRHCRHCLGGCPGDCLIGDSGRCSHGWTEKHRVHLTPFVPLFGLLLC
jgi:hypothetical protein